MLQRYAEMLASDGRRRIAVVLLLVNVSLVILAAVWRHAAADDPELIESAAADRQGPVSAQTDLPSSGVPAQEAAPPATSAALPDDPVMEELRKVIRNPEGGLDIPRLDETSPLAARSALVQSREWSGQMQQRIESVHCLSTAAVALVREARSLADAGLEAESAALMQRVAELREMIAALAAKTETRQ